MLSARLFLLQRLTALIMAPLVMWHLGGMIYAVRGGLDAAEILSRTQGNWLFGCGYELFVIAVSIHAAIGVRVVASEWFGSTGRGLDVVMWSVGLTLLLMGTYAVAAVVIA